MSDTTATPTTDAPASAKTEKSVTQKPRKIYMYKKAPLVCFAGSHYGPADATGLDCEKPVTKIEGAKGDLTVLVTQREKGKKGVTETWNLFVSDKTPKES